MFFQSCEKFTIPSDSDQTVVDQNITLQKEVIDPPVTPIIKPIEVSEKLEKKPDPKIIEQQITEVKKPLVKL